LFVGPPPRPCWLCPLIMKNTRESNSTSTFSRQFLRRYSCVQRIMHPSLVAKRFFSTCFLDRYGYYSMRRFQPRLNRDRSSPSLLSLGAFIDPDQIKKTNVSGPCGIGSSLAFKTSRGHKVLSHFVASSNPLTTIAPIELQLVAAPFICFSPATGTCNTPHIILLFS